MKNRTLEGISKSVLHRHRQENGRGFGISKRERRHFQTRVGEALLRHLNSCCVFQSDHKILLSYYGFSCIVKLVLPRDTALQLMTKALFTSDLYRLFGETCMLDGTREAKVWKSTTNCSWNLQ